MGQSGNGPLNPDRASLASGVQTNPEGGTIYMFTEASERAVVLLAVETFPRWTSTFTP